MMHFTVNVLPPESGIRTKFPVNTIDDLKGLKVRVPGRAQGYILEQLGAQAMTIAGAEVYTALDRGTVDAAEYGTPALDWATGIWEICKYWSVPGWNQPGSINGLMINMDVWNALPDRMKVLVRYAARDTTFTMASWSECDSLGYIEKYVDEEGITMIPLPREDLDRLQAWAWEFMEIESAANPDYAKIARSQIEYLKQIEVTRGYYGLFAPAYTRSEFPDLSEGHLATLR